MPSSFTGPGTLSRSEKYQLLLGWSVFAVTVLLAVIYGLQLVVMQRQLTDLEKASRMDARAWMKITHQETDINPDAELAMPLEFENVGRTPAKNVSGIVVVELLGKYDEPNTVYTGTMPKTALNVGFLSPNEQEVEKYFLLTNKTGNPEHVRVSKSQVESYIRGETYIVTHGRLEYDDIFNHHHFMNFCGTSAAMNKAKEGGAQKCNESNTLDEDGE